MLIYFQVPEKFRRSFVNSQSNEKTQISNGMVSKVIHVFFTVYVNKLLTTNELGGY